MRRSTALLLALTMAGAACSSDSTEPASTTSAAITDTAAPSGVVIVHNAEVYTVDEDRSWAEAFAYDAQGTIIAVGTLAEVRAVAGADAAEIDAGGAMVVPGFQDAHVHVPEAGLNLDLCFFPAGLTLADCEAEAADCAAADPDSPWVLGAGAPLFDFRFGESPLAALDRAVPDRPALILDDLGHAVWTNSLGLEAAGITADTPDPQGGVLHRDDDGQLTGLLLENAQQLVRNVAAADADVVYDALLVSMEELAAEGVTTVSDAGGYWGQRHPAAWQRARDEGTLTVRAANSLYLYPDLGFDDQLATFEARFSDDDAMLRFDTAKVYIDGILDLGTALMSEPYLVPIDDNHPSGFRYFDPDVLHDYVDALHALGYRINFHVIGDLATTEALDALEAIDDDPSVVADRRHRLTHTYLVADRDLDRFAELGVVADFQAGPDAIDPEYHASLVELIGEQAFDLIPTAAVFATGATTILSSDWDADPLPPLGTIERSLTRDSNALADLADAVEMLTIDAAYALGHDDVTGSIEVGKFADFVVLDQHLFDIDTEAISRTEVLLTVVGGTEVHRSPNFGS